MKYIILTLGLIAYTNTSFGQQTVGLFLNDSTAYNGYTLLMPFNATETYLIDNCGEIVNVWTNSTYEPGAVAYLLDDGSLLRTCNVSTGSFVTGGSGGRLEKYNWNDSLVWSYDYATTNHQQHHDIEVLPNGNILLLSFDLKTTTEVTNAGVDPNFYSGDIWSEKVVEIQPVGSDSAIVVWEWHLWDHLIQQVDSAFANYGDIQQNRQLVDINFSGNSGVSVDFFHANALAYNAVFDQIMISVRNFNEIWVIDHSTTTLEAASDTGGNSGMGGDLLYRWGNPAAYRAGEGSNQYLFGQHDAHWIPKGYRDAGKIIIFNNGFNAPVAVSAVEIIDPPVDFKGDYTYQGEDPYGPTDSDWNYPLPIFMDFISGANRLPNGNTLICSGPDGHIFELDSLDNIVWKYISPVGLNGNIAVQGNMPQHNSLFRAYRYGADHPAFVGKNLTPIEPIEIDPLPSTCVIYADSMVSTIPVTTDLDVRVIQNPIQNMLRIENKTNGNLNIQVIDLLGRTLLNQESDHYLINYSVENWANGAYVVLIRGTKGQRIFKQIVIKQDQ